MVRFDFAGIGVAVLVTMIGLPGCEKTGAFEPCPMTCKQQWDCGVFPEECGECKLSTGEPCRPVSEECPTGVDCYASCLIQDHPQCLDGPCLLYQSRDIGGTPYRSEPFCSVPCSSDADCGEGSRCRDVPAAGYQCEKDSDCKVYGSWSFCADEGGSKRCAHRFCVPDSYLVTAG